MRSRTQKTHQRNAPDAGTLRGFHHVTRSLDMDLLIRLTADLAVDARAMSHGLATCECAGQNVRVRKITCNVRYSGRSAAHTVAPVRRARDQDNVVPLRQPLLREMAADKTCASSDCDLHDVRSFFALRRCSICVGHTVLRKSPTAPAISAGSR